MTTIVRLEIPKEEVAQLEALRAEVEGNTGKHVSNDALVNGIVRAWIRMSRDYITPPTPRELL
jgi:hypothetical protein